MAISLSTLRRSDMPRPPIGVLYGKPGVGKTTLMSYAPNPVFLMTEDGLISPRLSSMPHWQINSFNELMEALAVLGQEQHGFQTIVIDSLDRLAPMVAEACCVANNWRNLDQPGYGKGNIEIVNWWVKIVEAAKWLRNTRGFGVWFIGHHSQRTVNPPDNPPYTQFTLTLPEREARLFIGEADIVAFATHPVITTTSDGKFGQQQTRAISDDRGPVIHVQERGAHIAKNRYDMPPTLPMSWGALASFIPAYHGTVVAAPSVGTPAVQATAH